MSMYTEKNIPYELYYNFKVEIHTQTPHCWIITNNNGEVGITNTWQDTKWTSGGGNAGDFGYTYWASPDWQKSGMVSWVKFTVRFPRSGPPRFERVGPDNRLTCFHKHYDQNTGEFKYYKKETPITPETKLVKVEFREEDRVIKNRETGFWDYLDPNKKTHWKKEMEKFSAYPHHTKKK